MTRDDVTAYLAAEIGRLIRFVRRRMGGLGAVEAEDVVQDVALRLFALPDVARPVENMAAYVFSALQNRITDLWRRQSRSPEFDSEPGVLARLAAPAAEDTGGGDPAILAERRERLQRIAAVLEALPVEDRAVVIATEIEGRSFRELAEEWATPIGTLLARKHRALQKLRAGVGSIQKENGGKP